MTNEWTTAIEDEAILWQTRLNDGDSAAWEEFTLWLEADPRHVTAFDTVSGLDDVVDQALVESANTAFGAEYLPPIPAPANDESVPDRKRRHHWVGAAIAASLILAMAGWAGFQPMHNQRYDITTGTGEHRNLVMADGTRIALNGASRLTLDHRDLRYASLDRGEALFEVIHNAAHPFALHVGEAEVRDVGTVFNVVREESEDIVEVKEGSVSYEIADHSLPLHAGQALRAKLRTGQLLVSPRQEDDIGTWRFDRLNYDMESFGVVAQDISRNLGVKITVDPMIEQRRFSGTIVMGHDHTSFFKNLSILLDSPVNKRGGAWHISENKN